MSSSPLLWVLGAFFLIPVTFSFWIVTFSCLIAPAVIVSSSSLILIRLIIPNFSSSLIPAVVDSSPFTPPVIVYVSQLLKQASPGGISDGKRAADFELAKAFDEGNNSITLHGEWSRRNSRKRNLLENDGLKREMKRNAQTKI
jgi:hypothetical protein